MPRVANLEVCISDWYNYSMAIPYTDKLKWAELTTNYIEEKISSRKLPTISDLSYKVLGCSERTIYRYLKDYKEGVSNELDGFCQSVEFLLAAQKSMLVEFGLENKWNSGIVRFLLANNFIADIEVKTKGINSNTNEGLYLLRQLFIEDTSAKKSDDM